MSKKDRISWKTELKKIESKIMGKEFQRLRELQDFQQFVETSFVGYYLRGWCTVHLTEQLQGVVSLYYRRLGYKSRRMALGFLSGT